MIYFLLADPMSTAFHICGFRASAVALNVSDSLFAANPLFEFVPSTF